MPDRHINEAIEHLDEGVDEVRKLMDRVERLDVSRRWFRILLALIVAAILFALAVGVYVANRFNDERVTNCRAGNERFDLLMDFIDLQVDSPEGQSFVDGMRAVVVIDCDNDGGTVDDITPQTEES